MSPCGRVRLCIRSFVVAVVSKPVHDLSLRLSSPLLPFLRAILINLNSIEFNGRLVKPSRVQCIRSYTPWIYFSFSPSSLSPPPPIFVDNYYVYARERERERWEKFYQLTTIPCYIISILICAVYFHYSGILAP